MSSGTEKANVYKSYDFPMKMRKKSVFLPNNKENFHVFWISSRTEIFYERKR